MQNNLTTFDRNKFIPYSIGFDNLFDRLFDIDLESSILIHLTILVKLMTIIILSKWLLLGLTKMI